MAAMPKTCPVIAACAVVAAAGVLLPAAPAQAQAERRGFAWYEPNFQDSYFGLGAGGYFVADNTDNLAIGSLGDVPTTLSGNTGYGANLRFGATGYRVLRVELELSYIRTPVDELAVQAGATPTTTNADGFLDTQTALAWTYYDALPDQRFSPILGVGAGLGRARTDVSASTSADLNGDGAPETLNFDLEASGLALAWGFAGGASYRVGERLELELLYQSRHTWQQDFEASLTASNADYGVSVQAHTLTLGLRYPFGADS